METIYFSPISQYAGETIKQMIGYSLVIVKKNLTDDFIELQLKKNIKKFLINLKTNDSIINGLFKRYVTDIPSTSTFTIDKAPTNITDMFNKYLNQPIVENERIHFINEYPLPFHGTEKSLKELYEINSDAMQPVLDKCIESKRYQRHNYILDTILNYDIIPGTELKTVLMPSQLEEFTRIRLTDGQQQKILTELEVAIALAMFAAVEKNSRLKAVNAVNAVGGLRKKTHKRRVLRKRTKKNSKKTMRTKQ
jgi:hypothetical protein